MTYQTYWSILDAPTNSIKSYTVLLYIFIGAIILLGLIKKYKKDNQDYEKPILLWSLGSISAFSFLLFVYLKFFTIDNSADRITEILESPQVGKIEGVISNFTRKIEHKRYDDVTFESFQVDSVVFSYDDYLLGRFNRFSQTNNGILRDGLKVRITYSKGNFGIQKIEIAKENWAVPL